MNQLTNVPAHIANRQRRGLVDQASAGLGVSRPAHLSIRGGQFALVRADGARAPLQTTYLDMVVCDALAETSRIMYPAQEPMQRYEEGAPPICFSDNGVGPSVDAMQPQSPLCETCWASQRGTKQTFSGKETTACDHRKKIAFFIPGDPQLNIYEYQISPGSLTNFKAYCAWIRTQAGDLDIADFVTRVTQDMNKPNTYKFEAVGWTDETSLQKLEYITNNKLGDAVVNRGDKPCNPEAVARMLQLKGSTAALPAPAAPQQFSLPSPVPHQAQVTVEAPAAFVPPASPQQAPTWGAPQSGQQFGVQQPQTAPQYQQPQMPQQVANQGWQPAPGQVAETRAPEAPKQRKPRTPKNAPVDPVQAGAMAPATPQAQPQFIAPQAGTAPAFTPPGFVQQQLTQNGPSTRLQEPAHVNPAPQFGVGQPGAAPQSLADAMNMLPPSR